jgi:hypothetical protein
MNADFPYLICEIGVICGLPPLGALVVKNPANKPPRHQEKVKTVPFAVNVKGATGLSADSAAGRRFCRF